jgi:hypothetical protein
MRQRPNTDRRSGDDRRQIHDLDYFFDGGVERRRRKKRRPQGEQREGWVEGEQAGLPEKKL